MAAPRVQPVAAPHAPAVKRRQVLRNYANLPLTFEPNLGQSDTQVKFLAHGQGYGLLLTANRAVLLVRQRTSKGASSQVRMLSLELLGANPAARISGKDKLAGFSNYLLGGDPRQWHTNVPHYARVQYRDLYPGVDLVYYGRQQQLEYDFVLAPGADPDHIRLQVEGAQALSVNRAGALVLTLPGGAIQMRRPVAYQQIGNRTELVATRYVLQSGNRVALQLGNYDRTRTLVIDPQLNYFTYLGGTNSETAPAVAVDSAFNAYVAGTTISADFPTLNAFQGTLSGPSDVFITKFNSAATGVFFSTFLGGSGSESAAGIAVDTGFNVYVAGTTDSSNFPITPGSAVPDSPGSAGTNHVFVTELNSAGAGPVYSTYLAGNGTDTASGVAVGPQPGTVFTTGTTTSSNFATVTKPAGRGTSQFFVTKLNTGKQGQASLVYSTYIGGTIPSGAVTDGGGIAVDSTGNAYITGGTNYTDMPVVNAFQSALKGTENAFVAKLNPNGTPPALFLTYIGGSNTDIGHGIAVDSGGNAYVTGSTGSTDFPVIAATGSSIYQGTNGGGGDAFLTKVAAAGTSLIWSTFIGGSGVDAGQAVAVDASQNAFVTGSTAGGLSAASNTFGGGASDAFVAKFDISGTARFVTYLGGSGDDHGTGIALDSNANPYVSGDATSTGLATSGVYQSALNGSASDAFLAHYVGVASLAMTASASPNPIGIGNAAAFTFTISNPSGPDPATAVVFTDTLPGNGTFQNATPSQGACSAPAGSTLACSLGVLPVGGTATVVVRIVGTAVGPLSNSASVVSSSPTGGTSAAASTTVNDYSVALSPASVSIPAGQAATYTVTVSPVPASAGFPNGVSLKCSAGVPTAALCAFSTNPVVPNGTPVTSSLTITTTAPVPGTTASLFPRELRHMYAVLVPIGGIAFLGFGLGSDERRRKRLLGIFVLFLVLGMTLLQPACSSSSNKSTPPPFTPTGTYKITVSAISGTVTRTTTLKLVVQ
jgi:uncharacterized repeat protein (TIGR01451 family)